YTVLAGLQDWIRDWLTDYPDSQVVMTGGDSDRLIPLLHRNDPNLTQRLWSEPDLIFWGIESVRRLQD
ncbi:MAG: pantothenate kinase, partial [Leptolyngbyaceae cyanobacterium]